MDQWMEKEEEVIICTKISGNSPFPSSHLIPLLFSGHFGGPGPRAGELYGLGLQTPSALPLAEALMAPSRSLQGLPRASLSSCKCHSEPGPLPKIFGRKGILKSLTQTFVVLCNFMDLIQVKFSWETQALGQNRKLMG